MLAANITMTKSEILQSEMLALCPDFAIWNDKERDLYDDDDGTFSVHSIFMTFSHYISDKLKAKDTFEMDKVFWYIETKLGGDEEIDNAATTCCLENIMNRVPNSIDPATFVNLLGPQSREFCIGWDEWCGTQTEGL